MLDCEYTKPPKTYYEQIDLLLSRGLAISDKLRVVRHLSSISYFRLSAYMLPFKKWDKGELTDDFIPGITWDHVYDLYVFDRKLRLLIFDAIERL